MPVLVRRTRSGAESLTNGIPKLSGQGSHDDLEGLGIDKSGRSRRRNWERIRWRRKVVDFGRRGLVRGIRVFGVDGVDRVDGMGGVDGVNGRVVLDVLRVHGTGRRLRRLRGVDTGTKGWHSEA